MYGPNHEHIMHQLAQGQRVIFDAKNEHYIHDYRQWVQDAFVAHPGQGMFVISGDSAVEIPGVTIAATPYWYWIMDQAMFTMFGLDQRVPAPNPIHKFFMSIGLADDQSRSGYSLTRNNNWFLCEKSYRPIAAQHPFVMASTAGNLAYLQSQGFETFPELFDESYDDILDWRTRMNRIVEIVRDFDLASLDQVSVQQKIKYNHSRFFDTALTDRLCAATIIDPVLEFVHG